jgi:hypothetical protein
VAPVFKHLSGGGDGEVAANVGREVIEEQGDVVGGEVIGDEEHRLVRKGGGWCGGGFGEEPDEGAGDEFEEESADDADGCGPGPMGIDEIGGRGGGLLGLEGRWSLGFEIGLVGRRGRRLRLPAEGLAKLAEGLDGEEGFVVEGDAEALLYFGLELKAAEAVEVEVFLEAGGVGGLRDGLGGDGGDEGEEWVGLGGRGLVG